MSLQLIETVVGFLALVLSTVGFLVGAYAIAVVGLIVSGVGFGMLVARGPSA